MRDRRRHRLFPDCLQTVPRLSPDCPSFCPFSMPPFPNMPHFHIDLENVSQECQTTCRQHADNIMMQATCRQQLENLCTLKSSILHQLWNACRQYSDIQTQEFVIGKIHPGYAGGTEPLAHHCWVALINTCRTSPNVTQMTQMGTG